MICLLGGTFDPVHNGHVHAAQTVAAHLDCPVRMVLAARPPHRPPPVASVEDRWAMLSAACAMRPELIADDMEVHRPRPSYTVDTLRRVRLQFPNEPIFWAIGVDAFRDIRSWHRWRCVFALAHLLLLDRPGSDLDEPSRTLYKSRRFDVTASAPRGGILKIAGAMLNVSATAVRAALAAGRPVADLLPDGVAAYIRHHELYATEP